MALKKEKKKEIVSTLGKIIKDAKSFVFVNFHGLNVAGVSKVRRKLREENIGYMVAKKTLLKRALGEHTFEGELPPLDGEVALVYGEDALAPARGIHSFSREFKDALKIVGGIFEGKYLDAKAMLGIATIPPKEVLIAQFVNLINSPIARLAVVLNQVAEKKGEATAQ
ncbi:MAG: 50S ribosomal protein L10 [bacterium]|nr:50S ribosomal protein L10 [bacterium]